MRRWEGRGGEEREVEGREGERKRGEEEEEGEEECKDLWNEEREGEGGRRRGRV